MTTRMIKKLLLSAVLAVSFTGTLPVAFLGAAVLASAVAQAEPAQAEPERTPIAEARAAQAAADKQWFAWNDPAEQYIEPFRIFDNVYYVGMRFVSVYLIDTGAGLILIDALFGPHVERLLTNIRTLGFDPQDVRYVLVTHGHFDHAGGARPLQEATGARIGMTGPDWDLVIDAPGEGRAHFVPPARDLTLEDGDQIMLGQTVVHCWHTPGHTEGVASFTFDVLTNGETHTALVFGGAGQNFEGADRFTMYIDSIDRMLTMDHLSVSLPNHMSRKMLEQGLALATRPPGPPHPFVDPQALTDWLQNMRARAVERLAAEPEAP